MSEYPEWPEFPQGMTTEQLHYHMLERIAKLEAQFEMLEKMVMAGGGTATPAASGETDTFKCPYIVLSKRVDGRYEAEYGLELGDGNIGEFPGLKYVGEEEEVRSFFPSAVEGDLPLKVDVDWTVTFSWGREIKGSLERFGERKHYKDLVKVEEMKSNV